VCVCVCVCVCVRARACVRVLHMCPHTTTYPSSYYYICILMLLHMSIYVSSYCYIFVLILLCVSSCYYVCLKLLYMCVSSYAYAGSNPPQQDLYQERVRELPRGFKRWHMSMHWCRLGVCVVKGVACLVCVRRSSFLFMS